MPNTAGQSGQTYFDSPIFNGPTPHEGPRALAVNCPFTSEIAEFNIDLTLSQTQAYISVIQGVFVDNSDNADVVSITANGATNQTIDFPAGAQGYIPILATKPTSFNVASAGAVTVPLIFLNVSVPAIIWGESSGGGGGSGVIEIVNPGSQPSIGAGVTTTATSDGSGNLMTTLNAWDVNEYFGHTVYDEGVVIPLLANSSYNNGLNVCVTNSPSVTFSGNLPTVPGQETIETAQFSLTTSQTEIFNPFVANPATEFTIHVKSGGGNCFIGNNGVTDTTGFEIEAGDTFTIGGVPSAIYACSDSTCVISILGRGY